MRPKSAFGKTRRIVEFWHVVEKLAAAPKAIHPLDVASPNATHAWRPGLLRPAWMP